MHPGLLYGTFGKEAQCLIARLRGAAARDVTYLGSGGGAGAMLRGKPRGLSRRLQCSVLPLSRNRQSAAC